VVLRVWLLPLLTKIALIGWVPLVLLLFWLLPGRRALLVAVIAGTLFLPEVQLSPVSDEAPDPSQFVLPGVAVTKPIAIGLSALLGALVFDWRRLLSFRPRWFDVPMLVWCLCPLVSDLGNGASLLAALVSTCYHVLTWGGLYFLGRIYFNDLNSFRELTIGILIAGLVYAPLCLFEAQFIPQLHEDLYGFFPGPKNEVFRSFAGIPGSPYRPVVFMSHGLMLNFWMRATAVVGFWLLLSEALERQLPHKRSTPSVALVLAVVALLVTALWIGALGWFSLGFLGILGICQIRLLRVPILLLLLLLLLLLVPPVFVGARISGWTGESLIEGLKDIGVAQDRLGSLDYRLRMENRLIRHYEAKPVFGWGDFNQDWRKAPPDPRDRPGEQYEWAVADSMWVIALAKYGFLGLAALWTAMLLPVGRFMIVEPPRLWLNAALAPAVSVALVLLMYMIDNLFNGFYNAVFVLAAGALASVNGPPLPPAAPVEDKDAPKKASLAKPS
jgi:O-Antigen ligase